MENKYFQTDPFYYQSNDAHKLKYLKKSSLNLQRIFHKTQKEIFDNSIKYRGNRNGLRNFLFIAQSWDRMSHYELSAKATTLATCTMIFAIEGVCNHICRIKGKSGNAMSDGIRRMAYFMRNFFESNDKLILLNSFVFARNSRQIPMGKTTERHVMYRGIIKNQQRFKSDYCTPLEDTTNIHCDCMDWVSSQPGNKINEYLKLLAKHLYKMRCSLVHDGVGPIFCHTEEKPKDYAFWSMSIVDMYGFNKKQNYYRYESSLSIGKLEAIFIKGLWNSFCAGLPKK